MFIFALLLKLAADVPQLYICTMKSPQVKEPLQQEREGCFWAVSVLWYVIIFLLVSKYFHALTESNARMILTKNKLI